MEIEFVSDEEESCRPELGKDWNEIWLATCNRKDDRLLFIQDGKLVMAFNVTGDFIIQDNRNLDLYKNLKKVSKLEVKAILEAN